MHSPARKSLVFDSSVVDRLACAACLGALRLEEDRLACTACNRIYPIVDGIPVLIDSGAESRDPVP
jgi:uncharacterized protein YbaR (Trm112 family)